MELTDDEQALLLAAKKCGLDRAYRSPNGNWLFASDPGIGKSIDELLGPPDIFAPQAERLMRAAHSTALAVISNPHADGLTYAFAVGAESHLKSNGFRMIPIPARYRSEP